MDMKRGEISHLTKEEMERLYNAPLEREKTPLTDEEYEALKDVPEHERRARLIQLRRAGKAEQLLKKRFR